MKKITMYVARHGNTVLNESGKFRGHIDVPLNAKGRGEARELGKFFKGKQIGSIHSSDLSRSSETAKTIGQHLGLKVEEHSDLRPWDVGDLSGKPKKPNAHVIEDHVKHPEKQLPGGESLSQFRARFGSKIRHITRNSKLPALVVAHASGAHEVGTMVEGSPEAGDIKPGGVMAVGDDGESLEVLKGAQDDAKGWKSS